MTINIDQGHVFLLATSVVLGLLGLIYHIGITSMYEKKVEKLLDRIMSRSVSEYKRVQEPRKAQPVNRQPRNDEEMAMHERSKRAQEEGIEAMNEEIEVKMQEMREATGKAGVL